MIELRDEEESLQGGGGACSIYLMAEITSLHLVTKNIHSRCRSLPAFPSKLVNLSCPTADLHQGYKVYRTNVLAEEVNLLHTTKGEWK